MRSANYYSRKISELFQVLSNIKVAMCENVCCSSQFDEKEEEERYKRGKGGEGRDSRKY